MNTIDFDYLFIHTSEGWREGKSHSVSVDEKDCLALASKKTILLSDAKIRENNRNEPATEIEWQAIAFDRRNRLYLLSKNTCQLYRYSENNNVLEKLPFILDSDSYLDQKKSICLPIQGRKKSQFEQIAFNKSTLFLLDRESSEIHAYFFPSFQFRYLLRKNQNCSCNSIQFKWELEKPVAIETDQVGNLFVLDVGNSTRCIYKFNPAGYIVRKISFNNEQCAEHKWDAISFALGQAPDNSIYVLDTKNEKIFKFDLESNSWKSLASLQIINLTLKPQTIAVDRYGIISIAGKSKQIYQFDQKGRYVGEFDIEDECLHLKSDRNGELYGLCAKEKRIFHFGSKTEFSLTGRYISKVLDSKQLQCHWHRLALEIKIPEKTRFNAYYVASDQRIEAEQITSDQWKSFPNNFSNVFEDGLFLDAIGQFLILKFELFGDGFHSPSIHRVRVYFQRDSYLRYLPATYQEDAKGKDFLERFLSLYESMSLAMDEKISNITQYFDPDVQEKEFLDWLSTWLAVMTDENWDDNKQRTLLKESFELYKYRGTQKTLRRVIEIFCGWERNTKGKITIIEHWRVRPPMILNKSAKTAIVGINSFVGLNREEGDASPEAPFAKDAYDFTVIVNTSHNIDENLKKTLKRLIEVEKPAHTRFFLRTTGNSEMKLGGHSLLGVDTVIGKGQQPMLIGKNSRIGKDTLIGNRYRIKGRLSTRARVDIDAILS